jgi:hypothetical protein
MLKPVLALLASTFVTAVGSASTEDVLERAWQFRALLDGKPIGQHHFTLTREDDGHVVTSKADFAVKVLFVTAYRYQHHATERWTANCLDSLEAATNDNGDSYAVEGTSTSGSFEIETREGRKELPECVMTFAYWNPAILDQTHLLNAQDGSFVDVNVEDLGVDTLQLGTATVQARRFDLHAGPREIALWYSIDGQDWLALESPTEKGHRLRYERIDTSPRSERHTPPAPATL